MRLLNTATLEIEFFIDDEVTLQDMEGAGATSKKGYEKVKRCCSVARTNGFEYVWIDTCCIDKTSSAELSEAINSMYRWYQEADVCYTYLADVRSASEFSESEWFTSGWTLQELIAPSTLQFFNQEWIELGTKESLASTIFYRTAIPLEILLGQKDLETTSVAQRMSWAAQRKTTRVEDRAYSLLGIFGINMPLIYGEGKKAFFRIQEEILRVSDDHSIFAWRSREEGRGGLLATSPDAFKESATITTPNTSMTLNGPLTISNKGIHLELLFVGLCSPGIGLAILQCRMGEKEDSLVAIYLKDIFLTREYFERVESHSLVLINLKDLEPSQYLL